MYPKYWNILIPYYTCPKIKKKKKKKKKKNNIILLYSDASKNC